MTMKEKNLLIKKAMLALCLMTVCWLPTKADVLLGDMNGDGRTNIDDVVELIDYLLSGNAASIDLANADVDHDGRVNINDVTDLIDLLLNQSQNPEPVEGDWVDLGLPSGTIWATRNVGAVAPEDYGDYFAWGETAPKDYYNLDTYKWYQGYYDADGYYHGGYTKYCTSSSRGYNGFVDNKTELDPSDDAACAHYPGGRMPSQEQIQELIDNCTWQWTQQNGVNGHLVTGPNGNTMFLPAAGYRWYESLRGAGLCGSYWSRTLYSSSPGDAYNLDFVLGSWSDWDYGYRVYGQSVRAVRVS